MNGRMGFDHIKKIKNGRMGQLQDGPCIQIFNVVSKVEGYDVYVITNTQTIYISYIYMVWESEVESI